MTTDGPWHWHAYRKIPNFIHKNIVTYYALIGDEVTDLSNHEQLNQ